MRLLRRLEETGATIIVPTTETRGDYVNVLPPSPSRRRGRVCSVQIRTGRVEFQTNSWDRLAERRGFDRLDAGNKAARTPHSDADTLANRELIKSAVAPGNLVAERTIGSSVLRSYQKILPDGRQVWAEVRNGFEITNGGVNVIPR